MSEPIVRFRNVSKFYKLYDSPRDRLKEALRPFGKKRHREFYALKNLDLEVKRGEILGIVGRNGSGKSTLLKIVAGVIPANSGQVEIKGKVSALLDLGAGLNPDLNGLQNIYFGGLMLGYKPEEMRRRLDEIVAFADIGDFIDQPLKTYSSGMRARLGFALAVHIDPEILVVDEVLAVGDALFQRKCFSRMEAMLKSGCTVLFVSQSPATIDELCTRAVFIDRGELILDGPPSFVTINYQKALFGAPEEWPAFRGELMAMPRSKTGAAAPAAKPEGAGEASRRSSLLIEPEETADHGGEEPAAARSEESLYLTGFQSKSRIVHQTAEVFISDLHISTPEGRKVNYLKGNRSYRLNCRITFAEAARDFSIACAIRSKKGLVLTGFRYPRLPLTFEKESGGTVYTLRWKFKCLFLPGDYFMDIGVVQFTGGKKQVLSAEYDALAFRVHGNVTTGDGMTQWGQITVEPELEGIAISRKSDPPGPTGGHAAPAIINPFV